MLIDVDTLGPFDLYHRRLNQVAHWGIVTIDSDDFLINDAFTRAEPADGRAAGRYAYERGSDQTDATEWAKLIKSVLADFAEAA